MKINVHKLGSVLVGALFLLSSNLYAADKVILPMGYTQSWTGRTMLNPFGRYSGGAVSSSSEFYGWPKIYKAGANDVYTIKLPTASLTSNRCKIDFRSPVTLVVGHTYRLSFDFTTNKQLGTVNVVALDCSTSEGLLQQTFTASTTASTKVTAEAKLTHKVDDLRIEFRIPSKEDGTTLTISNMSVYDVTASKEVWAGTLYYNHCVYTDANDVPQTALYITGRTESLDWTLPEFDDSMWSQTPMPMGTSGFIAEVKTVITSENLNYWIRRTFDLSEVNSSSLYTLRVCHDDTYEVYVNGNYIHGDESWTVGKEYVSFDIPWRFLRKGRNVIATRLCQTGGGAFYDCAFVESPNAGTDSDPDADITKLIINEVNAAQIDQTIDYSNNYGGWIELYNPTDKRVSLDYIFISDDPTNLRKHRMPRYGSIEPYGYRCIYFDHHPTDGVYGPDAGKQVPFKLDAEGGSIYLSDDGVIPFIQFTYPAAVSRCSFARRAVNSEEWCNNGKPTPEAANAADGFATVRLEAPVVDTDSKLFTDPFYINVEIPAGTTLRYTTDGSAPSYTVGKTLTNGRIRIDKTSTLRFGLFADGKLPSVITTRTYIKRDHDYYLPVIAVSTNPDNLYDDYIGVYVDGLNGVEGRNHGKSNINMDWDRPVNFEYITPDEGMVINQEATFTVSGGWSRFFLPTSFKIKANKIYEGMNSIDYPFYPLKQYNKYKQILVRNGGNDNDGMGTGRVRDVISQKVLMNSGFYVNAQDYQPTHVFFNGSYIGMFNLREPNNRFHGTANFGYDDDAMDSFEYSNGYFQKSGSRESFQRLVDLTVYADDPDVYEEIRQLLDIDSYVNFMAAETYVGPGDWIYNNNNVKGYRAVPDGRYRFTVHDFDSGWDIRDALGRINGNYGNDFMAIFNNLKQSEDFCRRFVNAYCIVSGSIYTPERVLAIADSICNLVAPALKFEGRAPWDSFNRQRNEMIGDDSRSARMQQLRNTFQLGAGIKVKLAVDNPQAMLMIDGQAVPYNAFDGTLFPPVTITASAPSGFIFDGWECQDGSSNISYISKGDEWSYYDRGSLDGASWKSLRYDDSAWGSGPSPLGYYTGGDRGYKTTISFGGNEQNKYPTYYFRKEIELEAAPTDAMSFRLNFTADDGFIVYINGAEAARYLMPEGDVSYSTYATTHAPGNPDSGTIELRNSLFREGRNIIAVEVHNNSATSSDIYWNAEIVCMGPASTTIVGDTNSMVLNDGAEGTYTARFHRIGQTVEECLAYGVTPVRINEISAGNEIYVNDYIKRDDWVELYNMTDEPIDVAGMYLSDDEDDLMNSQIVSVGEGSTVIPPHGHLIVWMSKRTPISQLHAEFKLGNDDDSVVLLTAADGSWTDKFTYDEHTGFETYGRYPDGGGKIYRMSVPTIHNPNYLSSYDFDFETIDFDNNAEDYGESGVEEVATSGIIVSEEYYNLQGIRVENPSNGIYIRRVLLDNGKVRTYKIRL